jgi:serine/threonine-protein kinase
VNAVKLPKRYKLTAKIPGGGMSEAYHCKDTHLDRDVLIKRLQPGTDPKRLLDELSALQTIRSKHVVQIYDLIIDDAKAPIAIVEEYLTGKDVTSCAPASTAAEFLVLIYPIAEGIADIHAHKRVHRDIKPVNMKLDAEGCLKIFDFGLSRIDGVDASTIGIAGTRGYIAPELVVGDDELVEFTPAVDTFAFGATALYLAVGALPADLKKLPPVLPCSAADFASLKFLLPKELAETLNRCLASSPAERPKMSDVCKLIALQLLHDEHKAILTSGENTYALDRKTRTVNLSAANRGSLRITYDGYRFSASNVQGDVSINNKVIADGYVLPGACVIILGNVNLGSARTFITVDVSHPEVGL